MLPHNPPQPSGGSYRDSGLDRVAGQEGEKSGDKGLGPAAYKTFQPEQAGNVHNKKAAGGGKDYTGKGSVNSGAGRSGDKTCGKGGEKIAKEKTAIFRSIPSKARTPPGNSFVMLRISNSISSINSLFAADCHIPQLAVYRGFLLKVRCLAFFSSSNRSAYLGIIVALLPNLSVFLPSESLSVLRFSCLY